MNSLLAQDADNSLPCSLLETNMYLYIVTKCREWRVKKSCPIII